MSKLQELGLINDYTVTWCIYLLACIGVFIIVWRISRSWPLFPRQALRFIVACIILVPVEVETGTELLAPAFIVAIFEVVSKGGEGAVPALSALVLATIIALLVYGAWLAGKYFYRKKVRGRVVA